MAADVSGGTHLYRDLSVSLDTDANDYTICGWFKLDANTSHYATFIFANATSGIDHAVNSTNNDGVTFIHYQNPPGVLTSSGFVMDIDVWYFVAMVFDVSGGSVTSYIMETGGSAMDDSAGDTWDNTVEVLDELWLGQNAFSEPLNGKISNVKLIPAALDTTELVAEAQNVAIQHSAGGDRWRLESDATITETDNEGNLTETSGSVTWSADEPAELAFTPPTPISMGLRVIINAEGDPESFSPLFQYKRVDEPDSEWRNL